MHTVSFWNNYHQVRSKSKDLKAKITSPTKNLEWTQLLRKGEHFLNHLYIYFTEKNPQPRHQKPWQYRVQSILVVGTTRPCTSGTSKWHLVLQVTCLIIISLFCLLLPYDFDVSTPYMYMIYCGDEIRVKILYIMDIINLKVFSS